MYAFKFLVRIVERCTQFNSVVQIFFIGSTSYAAKHGQLRIQVVNRFLVGHVANIKPVSTY